MSQENESPISHPISGIINELQPGQFIALFDSRIHDMILQRADAPNVEAIVCFERIDRQDAPRTSAETGKVLGEHRTAMPVGPGRTFQLKDLDKATTKLTNPDHPADVRYPVSFWRIKRA